MSSFTDVLVVSPLADLGVGGQTGVVIFGLVFLSIAFFATTKKIEIFVTSSWAFFPGFFVVVEI